MYKYKVRGFIGPATASKFAMHLANTEGIDRVSFTALLRRLVIETSLDEQTLDNVIRTAVETFDGKIKIKK